MKNKMAEEKKRPKISKPLRMLVWDRWIGLEFGSATCFCSQKIYQLSFEVAHITSWSKGGPTTVDNLFVCCQLCNKSMGNEHLIDYVIRNGLIYNLQADYPLFSIVNLDRVVGATKKEAANNEWEFVIVGRTNKKSPLIQEADAIATQQPKMTTGQAITVIAQRASETTYPYLVQGAKAVTYLWDTVRRLVVKYK